MRGAGPAQLGQKAQLRVGARGEVLGPRWRQRSSGTGPCPALARQALRLHPDGLREAGPVVAGAAVELPHVELAVLAQRSGKEIKDLSKTLCHKHWTIQLRTTC